MQCFSAAGIADDLEAVEGLTGQHWAVFGDSVFTLSLHVQRMLKGMQRHTEDFKAFNRLIEILYMCVSAVLPNN